MTLSLIFWSFYTNILVTTGEFVSAWKQDWLGLWWFFVPLAIAINFGVFKMVTSAVNVPTAFLMFSFANLVSRSVMANYLGQPIGRGTYIALSFYALGLLSRYWLGK